MKTIYTLLVVLLLVGCSPPAFDQYNNLDRAFAKGCVQASIVSSLTTEGQYLEFKATCKKAQ